MIVGILETGELDPDLRARHGDYPAMFRDLLSAADAELEFRTVRVVSGEMPSGPGEADAWLVTGSRHGVYDDLPWIAPLKDFLRECVEAGVPVVGICFGHQILAEALGGHAAKSDKGWAIGVHDYRLAHRPGWMRHVPDRFAVRAMHQDQVLEVPPGATLLAESESCPVAALAYGDPESPAAISLQPHPEFTSDFAGELIDLRSGQAFPEETGRAGRQSLERAVHNRDWARLIVDYIHRAAAGCRR